MRKDLTFVAMILDRSGSMNVVRDATVKGINDFISKQKDVPGECLFTLAQFNDKTEFTYDAVPIKEVPEFSASNYEPSGWTALNDALGYTINSVGAKLRKMDEKDRPSNVIIVVQTDGQENSSREFTREKVKEMVKHQESVYNWSFLFLGANIDAVTTGATYGFNFNSSMNYVNSPMGIGTALDSFNGIISSARTNGTSVSWTEKDRLANSDTSVKVDATTPVVTIETKVLTDTK